MKYKVKINRNSGIPEKELLDDLKTVGKKLEKRSFSMAEYDKKGNFSSGTFKKKFGWNNALKKAGLKIFRIGRYSNEALFNNILMVWERLGKQPSQGDLDSQISQICSSIYKKRFGSHNKALQLFVKWTEGENLLLSSTHRKTSRGHKTNREVSLRLRYVVMKRDHFKCQAKWHIEGSPQSPSEDSSVVLHIDHKVAWSKGGETVLENLQTICSNCNYAKSNL